jgi:hypothetical protein
MLTHRHRTPFAVGELPEAGLSNREIYKRKHTFEFELAIIPPALARGDIAVIKEDAGGGAARIPTQCRPDECCLS